MAVRNPVLDALGWAMFAPGDYARGALSGRTGERVDPGEFLGDRDAPWYQQMGVDVATDPWTLGGPLLQGLGAAALGMAAKKGAKELPEAVVRAQAKKAAQKARRKARKAAEREAVRQAHGTAREPQLYTQWMAPDSLKARNQVKRAAREKPRMLSVLEDLKREGDEIAELADPPEHPLYGDATDIQSELDKLAKDVDYPQMELFSTEYPAHKARHQRVAKSLHRQPLVESRLLKALRSVDPDTPITDTYSLAEMLRKTEGGIDEAELGLLLSNRSGSVPGGSIPYEMVPTPVEKGKIALKPPAMYRDPSKAVPIHGFKTTGELAEYVRRNPPLQLRESPARTVPREMGEGQATMHAENMVPGMEDNPAYQELAAYAKPGEDWLSHAISGASRATGHFQHLEPRVGLSQGQTIDPLFFLLLGERPTRSHGVLKSVEQLQSDPLKRILQGTDHPIARALQGQFPEIGLARALREAALDNQPGILWHPGQEVARFSGGELAGRYGGLPPDTEGIMHAAARRLANRIPGAKVEPVDMLPLERWASTENPYMAREVSDWRDELRRLLSGSSARADQTVDDIAEGFLKPALPDAPRAAREIARRIKRLRDMLHHGGARTQDDVMKEYKALMQTVEETGILDRHGLMDTSVNDDLAEALGRVSGGDFATRNTSASGAPQNYDIHFGPRWALTVPEQSRPFVLNDLRVPLMSMTGGLTVPALLEALQEARN